MGKYKEDLGLALELAGHADVVTMHRFEAADLSVKAKPDLTPVSDADLACEKKLRAELKKARPQDEVLGEEFGGEPVTSGRQWVIDPIDGTKNYVRGVPVWATLISLLEDGEPVVSVVSAPALRRRWYASKGAGAFRVWCGEPKQLKVSQVSKLADASVAFSSLEGWSAATATSGTTASSLKAQSTSALNLRSPSGIWLPRPCWLPKPAARLPTSKAPQAPPAVRPSPPTACCTKRCSTSSPNRG